MKKSFLALGLLITIPHKLCIGGGSKSPDLQNPIPVSKSRLSSSSSDEGWLRVSQEEKIEKVATSEQTTLTLDLDSEAQHAASALIGSQIIESYIPGDTPMPKSLSAGSIVRSDSHIPTTLTAGAILKSDSKDVIVQPKPEPTVEKRAPVEGKIIRPSLERAGKAIQRNDSSFFQKNYKSLDSKSNTKWMTLLAQTKANVFVREAIVNNAVSSITKGQAAVIAAQEELARAYIIQQCVQAANERHNTREITSRFQFGISWENSEA